MSKELGEIINELMKFDVYALLASLNEPPIKVLLKELDDFTEGLLKNLGDV